MAGYYPSEPITVWPFQEAPQEYRDLSPHGGDEDCLAARRLQGQDTDLAGNWTVRRLRYVHARIAGR